MLKSILVLVFVLYLDGAEEASVKTELSSLLQNRKGM